MAAVAPTSCRRSTAPASGRTTVPPAEGGAYQAGLGRSRGGFTSKLHTHGKAHGLPITLQVTAGQEDDCPNYDALMELCDSDPTIGLSDKGYDSDPIRQDLRDRGAVPEIPNKRNRHVQRSVSRPNYALRGRIECFINRLTNRRRFATRHDQMADSFLGFVILSSIRLGIGFVHATEGLPHPGRDRPVGRFRPTPARPRRRSGLRLDPFSQRSAVDDVVGQDRVRIARRLDGCRRGRGVRVRGPGFLAGCTRCWRARRRAAR